MWSGLKEGYAFIFARAGLLSVILIRCLDAFGSSAINVGTPIFADGLRQFTPGICYGLIYAAFGAGEMVGSLWLARHKYVTSRPPELVVGWSILFMAVFFALAFGAGNLWGAMSFMFCSAVAEGVTAVIYNIYLQKSPDDIRGRIVGTSETGVWTSMGIGMFLSGVMAETVHISHVVQLFSTLIVIGCVWHLVKTRRSSGLQPAPASSISI
jgi:predicted MFS family arabinose efflux permease